MAGFNTLVDDFKVATCKMHLIDPAGHAAYAVGEGETLDITVGPCVIHRDEAGNEIGRTITPPDVEGIRPCLLVLRSPTSPDARAFREAHECKLTFEDIIGLTLDKHGQVKGLDEKQAILWWASFIADFENLPHADDDGNTTLTKYTEENAINFVKGFPGVRVQMQRVMFDVGNFGRPLANG